LQGFPGSTVIMYNFIFNITKLFPKNNKNKTLLLCLILADYYDLHHSIFGEILAVYSSDANFNDYKLSMNDLKLC
jgi:hypothetical protein